MRCLLVLVFAFASSCFGQIGTAGLPASIISGAGTPTALSIPCNAGAAPTGTTFLFNETDITTGNTVWKCSGPGWTWQAPFAAPVLYTATTGSITAGSFILGGCTSVTTVTVTGAVVGTNAATASPIYASAPSGNMGLFNLNAWVSAANTVSVQGCSLGTLTSVPNFTARVLVY